MMYCGGTVEHQTEGRLMTDPLRTWTLNGPKNKHTHSLTLNMIVKESNTVLFFTKPIGHVFVEL